jgi:hypothetical protein
MKRPLVLAALAAASLCPLSAAGGDGAAGFTMTLDMKTKALEARSTTFSDEKLRPGENQHGTSTVQPGPGGWEYLTEDANIKFGYQAEWFGGSLKLDRKGLSGVNAHLKFGPYLKVSAGNDLESTYADCQGADPGLRVYNGLGYGEDEWAASVNPDNITQDTGLLLEGFFGPITAALAGSFHNVKAVPVVIPNTDRTEWADAETRDFQYGARLGSKIGDLGKINGSYLLKYRKVGSGYKLNNHNELAADAADAEVFYHHFGLYTSLTPSETIGITAGYAGIFTKYLDQFYRNAVGMVDTTTPQFLQNGLNLNARWKEIIPGLTLRTDHNYSFWQDKNYNVYGVQSLVDYGLLSRTDSASYGDVSHWLLWNGLGAAYAVNERINVELYARNLYREDSAKAHGKEYKINRNQLSVESKLICKFSGQVSAYIGVNWENTVTEATSELNNQGLNSFKSGVKAKATHDTADVIKIPLGITMNF